MIPVVRYSSKALVDSFRRTGVFSPLIYDGMGGAVYRLVEVVAGEGIQSGSPVCLRRSTQHIMSVPLVGTAEKFAGLTPLPSLIPRR